MIDKLFDWKSNDEIDTLHFQYYGCTLKKNTGRFKEGAKIEIIVVNYGTGNMLFFGKNDDSLIAEFTLSLLVL